MTQPENGHVPANALVTVQTGVFQNRNYSIQLETATAAAFRKAQKAGGLTISPDLGGNRDSAQQMDLHLHPAAHGSNLAPSQIRATGSTHGWGTCVDIAAGNAWFEAHCGDYGFVRESPAGETNHYRYLHPTWAPAVVLGPKQRLAVVLTDGFTGPGTDFSRSGAPLQPDTVGNFTAFCHSPAGKGGVVGGIDVWYLGTSGRWFWAGGFSIVDGSNLTDLTAQFAEPSPVPVDIPTVPVPVPQAQPTQAQPSLPEPAPVDPVSPDPHRAPVPAQPVTITTPAATTSWFAKLIAWVVAALGRKQ